MLGTTVSEAKEICAPPFEHETVLYLQRVGLPRASR